MGTDTARESPAPNRDTAVPDSYAIYVDDRGVDVWQYRVDLEEPGGAWQFVETHDAGDDLRVSLELATLTPPSGSGYWVYSRTYDCETDCK
ncbi:hypothetical protein [Halorubrum sp. CGM4_25_10-8A]|uniref:hypothetical protein n=1 Tax=Halorubrum sp. CGM4_25_10-8A TaxID=2518116 RepID=UPI0010F6A173|nr:hypothetical protein [Halorubrum sp. CGM4_25_10-8A]TKX37834.1 hypothetical protein EXE52_14350 [Halorubrum sp. CGM4_25_10-8A]